MIVAKSLAREKLGRLSASPSTSARRSDLLARACLLEVIRTKATHSDAARGGNDERGAAATRSGRRKERQTRSVSRSTFGDYWLQRYGATRTRSRRDETNDWRQKRADETSGLLEHTVQQMLLHVRAFGLCEQQPLFVNGEV